METSAYVFDVAGHAIQIIPPMLLYFLCVPGDLYRCSRARAMRWFVASAFVMVCIGSAVKLTVLDRNPHLPVEFVTVNVLCLEFILLVISTRFFVRVFPGPHHILMMLILLWATMQYNISTLILRLIHTSDVYDEITLFVFAAVTAALFFFMKRVLVPYAREYLLMREMVRSPAQIMVFFMSVISVIQIFIVAWRGDRRDYAMLAIMSVCITVAHWMLIRYVVVQEKRARTELHLLASQIRPHFILNTLNAISNLVDEDPDAARQAIYDFSGYLRANFYGLDKETPIWFREEMKHTGFYLSIEKLRFREELNITIDTPVMDFEIPALTVQPMAENAIRHGLRGKEGVGNLWLQTRETDAAYEVVIRDDGVGMTDVSADESADRGDSKEHHGLVNVRERLKRMVGGTLLVESEPGKGTTVIIRIPKEKQTNTREAAVA